MLKSSCGGLSFNNYRRGKHVHTYSNAKNLTPANHGISDISVPGIRKIFDTDQHVVTRVVWCLMIALCTGFSLYQISCRLDYYFSNPVAASVSMDKSDVIDFPAIMLCSAAPVSKCESSSLFQEQYERYFSNFNCSTTEVQNLEFNKINLSLDQIWTDLRLQEDIISVVSKCIPNEREEEICNPEEQPFPVMKDFEDTMAGQCIVIKTTHRLKYRGSATTNIDLLFSHNNEDSKTDFNSTYAKMLFLEKHQRVIYEVIFSSTDIQKGSANSIRLEKKMISHKNRLQRPCWDKSRANNCINECINNHLKTKISCSLPFSMSISGKQCNTWNEYETAWHSTLNAFTKMNLSECACNPSCEDEIYSTDFTEDRTKSHNRTTLKIFFRDNVVLKVTETALYDFSAVLSDLGGSLGFYVGVCVLTIAEIFEVIVRWLLIRAKTLFVRLQTYSFRATGT